MQTKNHLRSAVLLGLISPQHAADEHVRLIRQVVRPELNVPTVSPTVGHAIATPSSCVPDGAVMLSVTNKHHARLRPLQFSLIRHRACFMQRVVSVCFNNVSDAFGSCVQSTFNIPPSDFRRSNYANLIWAKWKIISDALHVAKMALWLDADVVILRNPWTALRLVGSASQPVYDIRYQSEPPPTPNQAETCTKPLPVCPECASFNGGQLLVRSAALARAVYLSRPVNLSNTDRLDQDWADAIIHNDSSSAHLVHHRRAQIGFFSSCVLPESFAAQCWMHPSFVRSEPGRRRGKAARSAIAACSRATQHFNCVPTRRDKGTYMKTVIGQWIKSCGNSTADE